MTKEEIYDAQISPLMSQFIAICKTHKIANVCCFSLDHDEGLFCTPAMTSVEFNPPEELKECVRILHEDRGSPAMLTVRGGDGKIKECHAIFS